jgi:hypothetical protein
MEKIYNKKLIDFMQAKADFLTKLAKYEIDPELYFNSEDAEDIMEWEDLKTKITWNYICDSAIEEGGLGSRTCPFCIYMALKNYFFPIACDLCTYASRHGKCMSENEENTYSQLIRISTDIDIGIFFDKYFYKKVIDKIEEKYNGKSE